MKRDWTAEELIAVEREIADIYNSGKIRAPVHLSGGNEEDLIRIFRDVRDDDWVCSAWRSHYHCLLKGVPSHELITDCIAGHSITLTYPKQRVITSAIVGGILPIALGIALGIKRSGKTNKVWCFLGDMTWYTGIYRECKIYGNGRDLPIRWVVENNEKSVGTPTWATWSPKGFQQFYPEESAYKYVLPWPHAGAGKWVEF